MPKYKVLEPLNHNQAHYQPGVLVDLSEEQAAPLQAVGVIGEASAEGTNRMNAADTIALIKTIQTKAELYELAAENQDRKSVLDAIEKRSKELEA